MSSSDRLAALGRGETSFRRLNSSFLGLPFGILNINHKKGTT